MSPPPGRLPAVVSMSRHFSTWPSLWIVAALLLLSTNVGGSTTTSTSTVSAPTTTPGPLKCEEIENDTSFDEWKSCKYNQNLGNSLDFVVLDFSSATQDEITNFFGQADSRSVLYGGIRIVENKNLQTLNFGQIEVWAPSARAPTKNAIFIEIRDNPKLKEILWKITSINPGEVVQVLVYNNPSLNLSNEQVLLLKNKNNPISYIEQDPGVCWFQHPNDPTNYTKPGQDLLDYCTVIKGDLDLENMEIKGPIALNTTDTCIRLVAVNMTNGKLTFDKAEKGAGQCQHGSVKSEIRDNPGLCGDELAAFEGYFQAGARVAIHMDGASCTLTCNKDQALHKYTICKEISQDVDIGPWFTDSTLKFKAGKLETAPNAKLTIEKINSSYIGLDNFRSGKSLVIKNNGKLADLILPVLTSLETLTVMDCPLLPLAKLSLPKLKVIDLAGSVVECHTAATGSAILKMEDIRLCTIIKGPLILNGPLIDLKPGEEPQLTAIDGCVTVEDTKLENLDFLMNVTVNCNTQNTLNRNPNLCPPPFLKTIGAGNKEDGCGNFCTKLSDGHCTLFKGDLIITSSTTEEQLALLEVVEGGSLIINGTTLEILEFPVLKEISAPTAPALKVADNPELRLLKMANLKRILTVDNSKPVIHISNNPRLRHMEDFIPAAMLAACGKDMSLACYRDRFGDADVSFLEEYMLVLIALAIAVLILLVGAGIWIFCCVKDKNKQKKKKKKKTPAPLAKKQRKKPAPVVSTTTTSTERRSSSAPAGDLDATQNSLDEVDALDLTQSPLPAAATPPPQPFKSDFLAKLKEQRIHVSPKCARHLTEMLEQFGCCMYKKRAEIIAFDTELSWVQQRLDRHFYLVNLKCDMHWDRFFDNLERERLYKRSKNSADQPKVCIVSIGNGFEQSFQKMTDNKLELYSIRIHDEVPIPETNEFAKARSFKMDYMTMASAETRTEYTIEVELIEIQMADLLVGLLDKTATIPWYELVDLCMREDHFIHTDVPEILMLLYFFFFTLWGMVCGNILRWAADCRGPEGEDMTNWWKYIYTILREYYNREARPYEALFHWLYKTMELFVSRMDDDAWFTKTQKKAEDEEIRKKMDEGRGRVKVYKEKMATMKEIDRLVSSSSAGGPYQYVDNCGDASAHPLARPPPGITCEPITNGEEYAIFLLSGIENLNDVLKGNVPPPSERKPPKDEKAPDKKTKAGGSKREKKPTPTLKKAAEPPPPKTAPPKPRK